MKERPIIMSGDNPRLILEGKKTQTRRVVKPEPDKDWHPLGVGPYNPTKIDKNGEEYPGNEVFGMWGEDNGWVCPYGSVGDRLWVRERLVWGREGRTPTWIYASGGEVVRGGQAFQYKRRIMPSIHMPRGASRITLEILKVRVERLQDLRGEDARAEGWPPERELYPNVNPNSKAVTWYRRLWDSLHGKGAWGKNPWVWVLEFNKV